MTRATRSTNSRRSRRFEFPGAISGTREPTTCRNALCEFFQCQGSPEHDDDVDAHAYVARYCRRATDVRETDARYSTEDPREMRAGIGRERIFQTREFFQCHCGNRSSFSTHTHTLTFLLVVVDYITVYPQSLETTLTVVATAKIAQRGGVDVSRCRAPGVSR